MKFLDLFNRLFAHNDSVSVQSQQVDHIDNVKLLRNIDQLKQSIKKIRQNSSANTASFVSINDELRGNKTDFNTLCGKGTSISKIAAKINEDTVAFLRIFEKSRNKIEEIKTTNDKIACSVIALSDQIVRITGYLNMINTITDQTKVVSFNAALEAASAGENGKRFAVVAN